MKKYTFYIMMMTIMSSCGITTKDFYEYNNWNGTNKADKIIKKRKNIRKLTIWNYTSAYFPNEIIEGLPNLIELSVGSDSSFYDSNLDDHLRIDANKLSKIKNLKRLHLEVFSMDSFPAKLKHESLEELDLSIDKLERLNTDFSSLESIKKMSIIMKDLKDIGKQTKFPKSLNQLTLYSKKLKSVSLGSFKNSQVRTIDLWAFDLSNENIIELIVSLEKVESLNKIVVYLKNCKRKKFLSKIVKSKVKIKYKIIESCS